MPKNNKILITGSTGFVGSNLIQRLNGLDEEFILLRRRKDKQLENLVDKKRFEVVYCDLSNKEELTHFDFSNISSLIHLASVMPESLEIFDDYYSSINNNFIGTFNLIDRLTNVSFISYISTIDVYGIPQKLPIQEIDSTNPISNYAICKLASEKLLQKFSLERNIPLTILRISHIYGPGEKERKVIPKFISSSLGGEPICIFGDGKDVRDYVYVEDVINSIILSLNKKSNGVYNIGSGREINIHETANKIICLADSKSKIIYKERNKSKIDLVCDISRAKNYLSYEPKVSFDEGLKREIEWFRQKNLENYLE
jgi:UDP-glucose 4-epimerase